MATILVVDDTALERHRAGALLGKRLRPNHEDGEGGLEVLYAANGREAVEVLRRSLPDVVVTDLMMPDLDGLGLVKEVRANYPSVPVVLITAHGSEDIAAQALKIGAAGYVPKKYLARDLADTVQNILNLTLEAREQQLILKHLAASEFHFVLDNDPRLISPLVGLFRSNLKQRGLCHAGDDLRVTIALREALVNAVTHGNLEVASALRETDNNAFHRLLAERRTQPPFRDRRVHVRARETPDEAVYVIRDEGPGFNHADLPDPTEPANLEKVSGRGLFLIRNFMDEVRFNPSGSEITLIKRRGQ